MTREELVYEAMQARSLSYSPYSRFAVGAAVLTKDGQLFLGSNIENASYPLSMCGERNAIYNAYCHGYTRDDIEALAIVADTEEPVSPCGACRQVLSELLNSDTPIYLGNLRGEILETNIEDLLPYAFDSEDL
jgi:cytidine deaminase